MSIHDESGDAAHDQSWGDDDDDYDHSAARCHDSCEPTERKVFRDLAFDAGIGAGRFRGGRTEAPQNCGAIPDVFPLRISPVAACMQQSYATGATQRNGSGDVRRYHRSDFRERHEELHGAVDRSVESAAKGKLLELTPKGVGSFVSQRSARYGKNQKLDREGR